MEHARQQRGGTEKPRRYAERREQQIRLRHFARDREAAHYAPMVRWNTASLGIQTRVAFGTVVRRSRHRLRRCGRCGAVSYHRWRQVVARIRRAARQRHRAEMAAGRRRDVFAHDSSRSKEPATDVHRIAMHPSRPSTLFMQKHWDVMRTDDSGDSWQEISDNLPSDFGFPIDVHAHEPETIYVVPIKSDSEHYPPSGRLRVYRSRTGGNEWEALTKGLPQRNCYVNVLRDAMSVDSLEPCG